MNFPILSSITFIPLVGALFVFLTREEKNERNKGAIYVSIFASFVNFFLALFLWHSFDKTTYDFQFVEEFFWISGFIKFKFCIEHDNMFQYTLGVVMSHRLHFYDSYGG